MGGSTINISNASRIDTEIIRFGGERKFAETLIATGVLGRRVGAELEHPDSERIRRTLLTTHIKLSANIAPEVFECAEAARQSLGLEKPIEIYQASGNENAVNWHCADIVFVSLNGGLISLLDRDSFIALFGHEFGHHLAHTQIPPNYSYQEALDYAGHIAYDDRLPDQVRIIASRVSMAQEFTADRFAALASKSLEGPLRLQMALVTGLPAVRLKEDASVYLEQARSIFEKSSKADTIRIGSHPEHLLRTYALGLFIETDVFYALTGQGSGSRKLADVDATLERILAGSKERFYETGSQDILPVEIQEFSLCAASLVAAADGALDESEAKALEDTFSSVLSNWKDLLDQENALARIGELLPVAISGGDQVAISVFNLLMHIMIADREIHIRELEVVAAIGRSLQQEPLFEYLLDVAVRAMRVDRSEKPVEQPIPALPPGKHETQAALYGLLSGFSRRGGGTIVLRRLLRIMGRKTWEASILSEIESAIVSHNLELVSPPVANQDGSILLDQSLIFRLTRKEQHRREDEEKAARARGLAEVKNRGALVGALKHLREKLVSGDGRSPSVRLYRAVAGHHFDLAQLDRAIEGRSERVVAMINEGKTIPLLSGDEAAAHKAAADLARALKTMDREFKSRVEETGCRDLFVGYPFLVGNIGGFFFRAPLVLHPFSLVGDGRGAGSYILKRREDDAATANQALIRLLFAKKGFAFTDSTAEELNAKAEEGLESLLSALRELGLEAQQMKGAVTTYEDMNPVAAGLLQEGIMVAQNAILGFFPQSSSDLLQDYDELLERLDSNISADLDLLLNSACDILPSAFRPAHKTDFKVDTPDQPIVYSDPSQREAVLRSRTARMMVMDGPPGSGKSQTIVNLVADAISRGERVAIVCEKRVALDVVKQRADAAGIGHLAVVVHDVYDDRKALYAHLADRLENSNRRSYEQTKLASLRVEAQQIEQQLAVREQLLASPTAVGLTVGQLHTMAGSIKVPAVLVADLAKMDREDLRLLAQCVRELYPFAHLWRDDSVFRDRATGKKRRSFAGATAEEIQTIQTQLRQAEQAACRYENIYASFPALPSSLEDAEPGVRIGAELNKEQINAQMSEMLGVMLALRGAEYQCIEEIDTCITRIEDNRAAVEKEKSRLKIDGSEDLKVAIENARLHVDSFFKFLLPSWKKAKNKIEESLSREWPERADSKITSELLKQIEVKLKAAAAWQSAEVLFKKLHIYAIMPREASELYGQLKSIIELWSVAARLASNRSALERLGLWPIQAKIAQPEKGWAEWIACCRTALELLEAQRTREAAVIKIAQTFPNSAEFDSAGFARLCDQFAVEANALSEADGILLQLEKISPDAAQIITQLADSESLTSSADWADSVRKSWAEAWVKDAENRIPNLQLLDQPLALGSTEKASDRLLDIHRAIASEEALRLASNADSLGLMAVSPAEPRVRRTPAQSTRETIIRECRKQRKIMPMRTFVRSFAKEGLLDVAPIWLMSPETTAILFPREPIFDLLIIDEASQCTVENGFPVLTRACRAVIAGDDKQMPPTSFFKASSGIEADEPDLANKDDVPLDAFESESLLVLARNVGVNSPLRWHYRSLFEELIAFSNHSMYGGSLLTIPSTLSRSAPPAIKWVRIDTGIWEDGANIPEAKRVVQVMREILVRPNPPTVGIVTFNIQQRRAILDEIDTCRSADPEFARLYDAASGAEMLDDRPFIKNLESVQGDERDVIIFSLGYAPALRKKRDGSTVTYVPARFGPLGQKGGERRLNVAVSRAKTEIVVVSSFDPSMLSVAHTKNDGPRLFKAFVEFAYHMGQGRRNQAEKILDLVNDLNKRRTPEQMNNQSSQDLFLPLHHQISLELERAGLFVETLVGTSEFRLPLALVRSDNRERYALAVLCEDGSDCGQVYEKYVHIPNVLAHRKWRHIRVNAREWHRERTRVVDRIRQACKDSEAAV